MPLIKTGRKRGRPSRGWGWSWFGRKQDPHLYDLLEMLLMGEPLQPYALPKKLDAVLPLSKPRNHTKLSDNLRDILQQAKVRAHALRNGNYGPLALNGPPTEDILSENYTDEVIRQQAIELVGDKPLFPPALRRPNTVSGSPPIVSSPKRPKST